MEAWTKWLGSCKHTWSLGVAYTRQWHCRATWLSRWYQRYYYSYCQVYTIIKLQWKKTNGITPDATFLQWTILLCNKHLTSWEWESCFFYLSWQSQDWAPRGCCRPHTHVRTSSCVLPFCVGGSRNGLWTWAALLGCGPRHPASLETLACHFLHWCEQHSPRMIKK